MTKAILVIGPDTDYLTRLKESSYKDLIDLVPIESHLRARTTMEDGDIVDMVNRLLHDEEIDGVTLIGQYTSETEYIEQLPDSVEEMMERLELSLNGMDDDDEAEDEGDDGENQLYIIGIGPESFVPTLSHDFINKLELEFVLSQNTVERGEIELESAEGEMLKTGTGTVDQLDLEAIKEEQGDIKIVYTTDDEEALTCNLPYAVYLVT